MNSTASFPFLSFPVRSIHALMATLLVFVGLCAAGVARAEAADRDKPMNAESDALRYDDARQVSVFTGNVVITKGTIVIRGDRVEVKQDSKGNQFGTVTGSDANMAFFRQKREGLDEYVEGSSDRIEYDGQADTVHFQGHAVMRRYRGTALADETAGSTIVYNNTTEVFTVDGGAASRTPANPTGRVRAMLTPVPRSEAAAPSSAQGSVPSPVLRGSPALDGVAR
jgi:lipopolysaccharide export system protein LptA